jgi:hypothetical protein
MNTRVADTITEKGIWVRFGIIPIYVSPLTFAQVTEISELLTEYKDDNSDDGETVMAVAMRNLAQSGNADIVEKIIVSAVFRRRWQRFMFGWLVRNNLTSKVYKDIFTNIISTYDLGFFLTTFLFMRGSKMKTKENENEGIQTI